MIVDGDGNEVPWTHWRPGVSSRPAARQQAQRRAIEEARARAELEQRTTDRLAEIQHRASTGRTLEEQVEHLKQVAASAGVTAEVLGEMLAAQRLAGIAAESQVRWTKVGTIAGVVAALASVAALAAYLV